MVGYEKGHLLEIFKSLGTTDHNHILCWAHLSLAIMLCFDLFGDVNELNFCSDLGDENELSKRRIINELNLNAHYPQCYS